MRSLTESFSTDDDSLISKIEEYKGTPEQQHALNFLEEYTAEGVWDKFKDLWSAGKV